MTRAKLVDAFRDFLSEIGEEIEQVTFIAKTTDGEEEIQINIPERLRHEARTRGIEARTRIAGRKLTEDEILEQLAVIPYGEGRSS